MCAEEEPSPGTGSVRNYDAKSCKRFPSYSEGIGYLFKKIATDQAIIEFDAAILWYMQPLNMTPQQYADGLVAKSFKVANIYDEGSLNDV